MCPTTATMGGRPPMSVSLSMVLLFLSAPGDLSPGLRDGLALLLREFVSRGPGRYGLGVDGSAIARVEAREYHAVAFLVEERQREALVAAGRASRERIEAHDAEALQGAAHAQLGEFEVLLELRAEPLELLGVAREK